MQQEQRENKRWLISSQSDGIPVGGVTFRVGVFDEDADHLGLHNLAVWLLRLATTAPTEFQNETNVWSTFGAGTLHTVFGFWGDDHGVAKKIDALISAIVNPPLELLADAIERARVENPFFSSNTCMLVANRFGPSGPGLIALRPFYLDQVDGQEVARYIREHFCGEGAMFWANSEVIAAGVRKSLPVGGVTPIAKAPIAAAPSTFLTNMNDRVALSMVVESSPAGRIAAEIVHTRIYRRVMELQALASQVTMTMISVDARHSMAVIEVLSAEAKVVETVDAVSQTIYDLKVGGPTTQEIEEESIGLSTKMHDEPVGESLDVAASEILVSGTSRWLDTFVGINDDMTSDILSNIQRAYQSVQVVADKRLTDHDFMFPAPQIVMPLPKRIGPKYRDILDRRSWYRIDSSYLSRITRPSPWSFKTKVDWTTDLRTVATVINWCNGTTAYLDTNGETTSMYWLRLRRGNDLKKKVTAQVSPVAEIEAKSDEDISKLGAAVKRMRIGTVMVHALRLFLVVALCAGLLLTPASKKPVNVAPALAQQLITTKAVLGTPQTFPNRASVLVDNGIPVTGSIADSQEIAFRVNACGGSNQASDNVDRLADQSRNYIQSDGFQLVMDDNTAVPALAVSPAQPGLLSTHLASGDCRQGFVTFEFPANRQMKSLFYQDSIGDSLTWTIIAKS